MVFGKYRIEGISSLMFVIPADMDAKGVSGRELLLTERTGIRDGGISEVLGFQMAKHFVATGCTELTNDTDEHLSLRVLHYV